MDVEITPEPSPEEREAIEVAIRRLIGGPALPAVYRSAWRETAIREAVEASQAVARPRSSRGATRA